MCMLQDMSGNDVVGCFKVAYLAPDLQNYSGVPENQTSRRTSATQSTVHVLMDFASGNWSLAENLTNDSRIGPGAPYHAHCSAYCASRLLFAELHLPAPNWAKPCEDALSSVCRESQQRCVKSINHLKSMGPTGQSKDEQKSVWPL